MKTYVKKQIDGAITKAFYNALDNSFNVNLLGKTYIAVSDGIMYSFSTYNKLKPNYSNTAYYEIEIASVLTVPIEQHIKNICDKLNITLIHAASTSQTLLELKLTNPIYFYDYFENVLTDYLHKLHKHVMYKQLVKKFTDALQKKKSSSLNTSACLCDLLRNSNLRLSEEALSSIQDIVYMSNLLGVD